MRPPCPLGNDLLVRGPSRPDDDTLASRRGPRAASAVHAGLVPGAPDTVHPVPPSTFDTDWDDVRLHVVTGKGGTGKYTVAASLALALASRGKTVLLCEVEGRQGIAQMFDVPPLPYEERLLAKATEHGHGDVYALAI